ncbi:conserved protein, unknown function [Hepatocystis sp. ex Piliocolobus tephrosceles]|nr:conserved protein, unknown function [Hepatocystis sp. ex Piliocolobus tephrosceles]
MVLVTLVKINVNSYGDISLIKLKNCKRNICTKCKNKNCDSYYITRINSTLKMRSKNVNTLVTIGRVIQKTLGKKSNKVNNIINKISNKNILFLKNDAIDSKNIIPLINKMKNGFFQLTYTVTEKKNPFNNIIKKINSPNNCYSYNNKVQHFSTINKINIKKSPNFLNINPIEPNEYIKEKIAKSDRNGKIENFMNEKKGMHLNRRTTRRTYMSEKKKQYTFLKYNSYRSLFLKSYNSQNIHNILNILEKHEKKVSQLQSIILINIAVIIGICIIGAYFFSSDSLLINKYIIKEIDRTIKNINHSESIKEQTRTLIDNLLYSVTSDEKNKELFSIFLVNVLKNSQKETSDLLLKMLETDYVKQKLKLVFLDIFTNLCHSKDMQTSVYNLLSKAIHLPQAINTSKIWLNNLFNSNEVKENLRNVVFKDILKNEEMINTSIEYMQNVLYSTLQHNNTKEITKLFFYSIISSPNFQQQLSENLWKILKLTISPKWISFDDLKISDKQVNNRMKELVINNTLIDGNGVVGGDTFKEIINERVKKDVKKDVDGNNKSHSQSKEVINNNSTISSNINYEEQGTNNSDTVKNVEQYGENKNLEKLKEEIKQTIELYNMKTEESNNNGDCIHIEGTNNNERGTFNQVNVNCNNSSNLVIVKQPSLISSSSTDSQDMVKSDDGLEKVKETLLSSTNENLTNKYGNINFIYKPNKYQKINNIVSDISVKDIVKQSNDKTVDEHLCLVNDAKHMYRNNDVNNIYNLFEILKNIILGNNQNEIKKNIQTIENKIKIQFLNVFLFCSYKYYFYYYYIRKFKLIFGKLLKE